MKKLYQIPIFFVAFLMTGSGTAQVTRNEAINLVINNILSGEIGTVNVYASYNTILDTGHIAKDDYISFITCPYPSSWVFFVDDMPPAKWFHPCRYIFVNSTTGQYQIIFDQIYPVGLQNDYELISHLTVPQPDTSDFAGQPFSETATPNEHLYAVLITGYDTKEQWNDICAIYNTLINVYGYQKDNIFVHYRFGFSTYIYGDDLDGGEPSDDIDYSSHHDSIHNTFKYLSGELTGSNEIPELGHSDLLLVWIEGHGTGDLMGSSSVVVPGGPLIDTELADWTDGIDCGQMIFYISTCNSGGFIDDLSNVASADCRNREVHTACDYDEYSVAEVWVTYNDTIPPQIWNVSFQENPFYWNAAARGFFPDFQEPWLNIEQYPVGEFPLYCYIPNHSGNWNPDTNGDSFITMGEAFTYSNWMDTWTPFGVFEPWDNLPHHVYNPPQPFYEIGFEEDLLKLDGIAGYVLTPTTIDGNFVIGGELIFNAFPQGQQFEFQENSELHIINPQGQISVLQNSTVVMGNEMMISGYYPGNHITITGNIQFGAGLRFHAIEDTELNLIINNPYLNTTITDAIFERAVIKSSQNQLILAECSFAFSGGVEFTNGRLIADHCTFDWATVRAVNAYEDGTHITLRNGCNFTNSAEAIYIENYPAYTIENCTINNCGTAIGLFYQAGYNGTCSVYRNYIHGNSYGISIYNAHADIRMNQIADNAFGLRCMNQSNVKVEGNRYAVYVDETQQIVNNDYQEVYATMGSFPYMFKANAIVDEDNPDPMVVYTGEDMQDVENNYWGEYFQPGQDLSPVEAFDYTPQWYLIPYGGGGDGDEMLYESARQKADTGDYTGAESDYRTLVTQYPQSVYAQASMKKLYSLEKDAGNDYTELKNWYATHPAITSDPDLSRLGGFLANFCDIALERWPEAIAWFENVIAQPSSFEDSLFAIIDLGYTYMLMQQSGYKSACTGTMPQYKFSSVTEYESNRNYLLSLLGVNTSKDVTPPQALQADGEILNIAPNPAKGQTVVQYRIGEQGRMVMCLMDYTGRETGVFDQGVVQPGIHQVKISTLDLQTGIYLCCLRVNGHTVHCTKLAVAGK
ncbi:MAG: hypothetical protein JXA03_09375 [Bacteroidales bacterium]|nr:hypothetical protein [Bacteroidales bacterium]